MVRNIEKVFLTITERCNNQCKYCFRNEIEKTHDMSMDSLNVILSELDSLNVKRVILSGGEVTLHPDFGLILKTIEKYRFDVSLFSNGIIGDKEINLINKSTVKTVYLSLDGTKDCYNETRGGATVSTIKNTIKKIDKKIAIMNTLSLNNYDNVEEFIHFCNNEQKIEKVNFNPIKILHNSYRHLELNSEILCSVNKKINEHKKNIRINTRSYYDHNTNSIMNCGAGRTSIAIDINGDVSGCIFGTSVSPDKFVVGNIFKEKLLNMWQDKSRWNIFLNCSDSVCKECPQLGEKCTGICCIEEYLVTNKEGKYLCKLR